MPQEAIHSKVGANMIKGVEILAQLNPNVHNFLTDDMSLLFKLTLLIYIVVRFF